MAPYKNETAAKRTLSMEKLQQILLLFLAFHFLKAGSQGMYFVTSNHRNESINLISKLDLINILSDLISFRYNGLVEY